MYLQLVLALLLFRSSCGSDSKSSESDPEMTTSYAHEDATTLGQEKSEETYKDWEKYWTALEETKKNDGLHNMVYGTTINWKEHANSSLTDKETTNTEKEVSEGCKVDERRWIFGLRHGERVDLTYGDWVPHCVDAAGNYVRKDLNLPLKLTERAGGMEAYSKDSPLTRVGQLQAFLVGEGLRLAGVSVRHVYASAALRCVATAHSVLEGLQAPPSVKVKVEPGLFEYKGWHQSGKSMAPFMTPRELLRAGYNVDLDYKPYVDLDVTTTETIHEYFMRNAKVMQSVVNTTEAEGGNIIFVGHAASLDQMALSLKHLQSPPADGFTYQISNNLLRVPYCALAAMRDKPMELVPPPCPPSINTSSGRFDWKILKDL